MSDNMWGAYSVLHEQADFYTLCRLYRYIPNFVAQNMTYNNLMH